MFTFFFCLTQTEEAPSRWVFRNLFLQSVVHMNLYRYMLQKKMVKNSRPTQSVFLVLHLRKKMAVATGTDLGG